MNKSYYVCWKEFKKREEYENPDEEIEELIDLIRDKKSPFFETIDWSRNGESIRETYIKDAHKLNLKSIEKCFSSIRLNDKNVKYIFDNTSKNKMIV